MASESPSILRGILVPDRRITTANIWASESSYDEAGPEPGVAAPQSDTAMELVASGTQSSGGALRVRAQSAGFPERDGAAFIWQQEGDTGWRGWDPPSAVSGFESAQWGTGGSDYRHPHAVALTSGVALVATCDNTGGGTNVRIHSRATDGTWTNQSIYTETPVSGAEHHPTLVLLPSGRLLCMFVVYDGTANLAQMTVYASDDDGATWALYQRHALREAIDTSTYTVERARAAYSASSGHIAWVIEVSGGTRNVLWWHASRDLAASFTLVEAQSGTTTSLLDSGARHDVVGTANGFVMVNGWDEAGFRDITVVRATSNAFVSPWSSAASWDSRLDSAGSGALPFTAAAVLGLEHTITAADDGTLYIHAIGRPATSGGTPEGLAAASYDNGRTWAQIGIDTASSTDGRWYWPAIAGTAHPQRFHAIWLRGRMMLAHNADDAYTPTVETDALWAAFLGGYTTAEMPSLDLFASETNSLAWFWHWLPYELPTAVGATAVGTASSETLTGDLEIAVTAGNTRYYRGALVTGMTVYKGLMAECEFSTDDDTPIGIRLRTSDNTNDYRAEILTTHNDVKVWDVHSATQIGSTQAITSGTRITLRIAVANGSVWAGYFTGDGQDREWTVITNGVALTDNGAGAGVIYHVEAGLITAGAKDCTFKWYSGHVTRADDVRAVADGYTNPDDLRGRPFSGLPIYVDDGTSIQALTGPCARGDEWDIDVRHQHGIENIHPWESASPRRTWRSTTTTAGMDIAWKLSDFDVTQHGLDHGLVALYLDNINFPTARLSYSDTASSATWTAIADLDFREAVEFERESNLVVPTTGGSATPGPYIHRNELVGGWFQFASGEVRPIVANTEGHWATGPVGEKRCWLTLGDVDDTESTSGTGHIWFPRALVILHDFTDSAAALRLTIRPSAAVPAPPDGYYQAGVIALGNVAVFGRPYDFGHRTAYIPNVEIEELPSGFERARKRGPRRREVSLRWDDGLITRSTRGTETSDYLLSTSTSTPPVASSRDVQWLLEGLDDQLDGPLRPGVLLPYIPAGTPDVVTHTWQRTRGAIYGRMIESPPLENIRGPEEVAEVIRTGFVWREVV